MLLLKSCPKCKGDIELGSGMDGDFLKCLMCGFSRYMPEKSNSAFRYSEKSDLDTELPKAS
jgi:hypothetical protein